MEEIERGPLGIEKPSERPSGPEEGGPVSSEGLSQERNRLPLEEKKPPEEKPPEEKEPPEKKPPEEKPPEEKEPLERALEELEEEVAEIKTTIPPDIQETIGKIREKIMRFFVNVIERLPLPSGVKVTLKKRIATLEREIRALEKKGEQRDETSSERSTSEPEYSKIKKPPENPEEAERPGEERREFGNESVSETPEIGDDYRKWMRETMIVLRRLRLGPEALASSDLWRDLILKLPRLPEEIQKEFMARLGLFRLGLMAVRPGNPMIGPEEILSAISQLEITSEDIAAVLKSEVGGALNVLIEATEGKVLGIETNPLTAISSSDLERIKRELADVVAGRLGISSKEAGEVLSEAYDLFFLLFSLQYSKDSKLTPAFGKILAFSKWIEGKFPPEFGEVFRFRFYGNPERTEPIGNQELGLGVDAPYNFFFGLLPLKDFEKMGFEVRRGREKIFNSQGEECEGINPFTGIPEKGTWILGKGNTEVEVIFWGEKENPKLVVVDVRGVVDASILGEIFEKVPRGALVDFFKQLKDGEDTRKLLLELLNYPIGSIHEDLSPYPAARLVKAVNAGLFGNLPRERFTSVSAFRLSVERVVAAYLEGVLRYARKRKEYNYRVGGTYFLLSIVGQAAEEGIITGRDKERLERNIFGGSLSPLSRYVREKISIWTAPLREPIVRGSLITGWLLNFLGDLLNYLFGGKVDVKKMLFPS